MIGSREEMKKITDDLQEPVVQNINAVLDGFIDRPLSGACLRICKVRSCVLLFLNVQKIKTS